MEKFNWYPFFYNGLETNIEVTKCSKVRKLKKDWYGKGSGSYKIKYGEVNFNELKQNNGYNRVNVQIKGLKPKTIHIHRIVSAVFLDYKFMQHKLVVDHIDSNKQNNHLNNLRLISHRENTSKEKSIKSGFPPGVTFRKTTKKYITQIQINNKRINLGSFNTIEEASQAYQNKLLTINN
jgi:hypothetical protein